MTTFNNTLHSDSAMIDKLTLIAQSAWRKNALEASLNYLLLAQKLKIPEGLIVRSAGFVAWAIKKFGPLLTVKVVNTWARANKHARKVSVYTAAIRNGDFRTYYWAHRGRTLRALVCEWSRVPGLYIAAIDVMIKTAYRKHLIKRRAR